jgi:high-affinity Fe2+/Pb2+ permease
MLLAALVGFGLAWWAATGRDLRTSPLELAVALLAALVAAGGLFWMERRRHPEEWEAWRRGTRSASLGELLLGRHLPRMR